MQIYAQVLDKYLVQSCSCRYRAALQHANICMGVGQVSSPKLYISTALPRACSMCVVVYRNLFKVRENNVYAYIYMCMYMCMCIFGYKCGSGWARRRFGLVMHACQHTLMYVPDITSESGMRLGECDLNKHLKKQKTHMNACKRRKEKCIWTTSVNVGKKDAFERL
jgi:hypothetical protein